MNLILIGVIVMLLLTLVTVLTYYFTVTVTDNELALSAQKKQCGLDITKASTTATAACPACKTTTCEHTAVTQQSAVDKAVAEAKKLYPYSLTDRNNAIYSTINNMGRTKLMTNDATPLCAEYAIGTDGNVPEGSVAVPFKTCVEGNEQQKFKFTPIKDSPGLYSICSPNKVNFAGDSTKYACLTNLVEAGSGVVIRGADDPSIAGQNGVSNPRLKWDVTDSSRLMTAGTGFASSGQNIVNKDGKLTLGTIISNLFK